MRWQTTAALLLRSGLAEGQSFHNLQFTQFAFLSRHKKKEHIQFPKKHQTYWCKLKILLIHEMPRFAQQTPKLGF